MPPLTQNFLLAESGRKRKKAAALFEKICIRQHDGIKQDRINPAGYSVVRENPESSIGPPFRLIKSKPDHPRSSNMQKQHYAGCGSVSKSAAVIS